MASVFESVRSSLEEKIRESAKELSAVLLFGGCAVAGGIAVYQINSIYSKQTKRGATISSSSSSSLSLQPRKRGDEMSTIPICVLGMGAYGTAIATVAARAGHPVRVYCRDETQRDSINASHRNPKRLSDYELPENITAFSEVADAVNGCEIIIHAIPAQMTADFLGIHGSEIPRDAYYVCTAKGIDLKREKLMSEIIPEALGRTDKLCYLSGPSFAKEMMNSEPIAVVVASEEKIWAQRVQSALNQKFFRVYVTTDVIGVEVGGALKNPLAIGAGMASGLGYGQSTLAAIVTRGAVEMQRLALALGARPETLAGLSGYGDLMLTCFCNMSRNRTCGKLMGEEGLTAEEAQERIGQTVEGVATTRVVARLMEKYSLRMPLYLGLVKVLNGEASADEALGQLMKNLPDEEGFVTTVPRS